ELLLAMIDESRPGNAASAIAHYRKVLELNPDNVLALNNLAYHLAEDDKTVDEALQYAQHLGSLTPGSPDVEDTLGWIYYRKGLYRTGVKHLQTATAKNPTAQSKYHLSMAYARAGNPDQAKQTLEQALKMNATLPEAELAKRVVLPSQFP